MRHEAHQFEIPGTAGLFNLSSEATDNGARTQAEIDKARTDRAAAEVAQAQLRDIDNHLARAFARLDDALNEWRAANPGNDRLDGVHAPAFMLMNAHALPQDVLHFKHRDTRNYVYLQPSGALVIPVLDKAFNRGVFRWDKAAAQSIEGSQP